MENSDIAAFSSAKDISFEQRKQLALDIIQNEKPDTHLAEEHNVSRKFLYNGSSTQSFTLPTP